MRAGTGFVASQVELFVNLMPARFRKSFTTSFVKAAEGEPQKKAS